MIPISRPRILVNGTKAYILFRDVERGSRVSVYEIDTVNDRKVAVADLIDFAVDAWEPTFDTCLWTDSRQLNVFVQKVGQGDGEQLSDTTPQPVSVLEVDLH